MADESAPTAVEYALLGAGIAAVIAGMVWLLGPKVASMFNGANTTWP